METTVEELLARLGSGIESTPGVCGGDPCVAGPRIPVWTLEQYRRLGLSEARILDAFPSLRAADLVNAWSYVAHHPDERERALRAARGIRDEEDVRRARERMDRMREELREKIGETHLAVELVREARDQE